MRRTAAVLSALLLVSSIATGCGSAGGDTRGGTRAPLPEISGAFGETPKISYDAHAKPSTTTRSAVLIDGSGKKVAKGDLALVDFVAQVYETKRVYEDTFQRSSPAPRRIGVGDEIAAWDKALVGVRVGSRVLMVVPPKDGYGKEGQPEDGIKGTDTLIFVVDVLGSYNNVGPHTAPAPERDLPSGLPKVTGALGARPTVTISKDAVPPSAPRAVIVARGTGPPVQPNTTTVLHDHVVNWAGETIASTWQYDVPSFVPVAVPDQPHPIDLLVGTPIGSRVLIVTPPRGDGDPKTDSFAIVVDVLAQHGRTKGAG